MPAGQLYLAAPSTYQAKSTRTAPKAITYYRPKRKKYNKRYKKQIRNIVLPAKQHRILESATLNTAAAVAEGTTHLISDLAAIEQGS